MTNNVISTAFVVISVLEAIVIITGNAFTIFVFWSQRLHLRRTCFLLINLAIADLLVGITELIVLATEGIPSSNSVITEGTRIENPSSAFVLLGSSTSIFFLSLISLERVYAVLWPLRHRVIRTRVYIYSIIAVWAFGIWVTGLFILSMICTEVNQVYVSITLSSFLFMSLLVICTSYLKIRSRLHFKQPGLEGNKRQTSKHNLRLSRTFFIVIALSLAFWLPGFVVYPISESCHSCILPTGVWIVNCLRLANSMVNPFVYSFRMPIFKDAMKRFWRKRRPQIIALRPVQAFGRVLSRQGSFSPQMGHKMKTPSETTTSGRFFESNVVIVDSFPSSTTADVYIVEAHSFEER